jgi:hypothetical protein
MLQRICRELIAFRRGAGPLTRTLLPVIVAIISALAGNHFLPRAFMITGLCLLDVGLIVFCVLAARSIASAGATRDAIESALERFFPSGFSRMLATELVVTLHCWRGLKSSVAPPPKSPLTYAENNHFGIFALILLISFVPDTVIIHLLMPRSLVLVAIILDVIGLYSCIWVAGVYGTMIAMPHQIRDGLFVARRGILSRADFRLSDIRNVSMADRAIFGVPALTIELAGRVKVERLFLPPAYTCTLSIPSDDRMQLCALLLGKSGNGESMPRNNGIVLTSSAS